MTPREIQPPPRANGAPRAARPAPLPAPPAPPVGSSAAASFAGFAVATVIGGAVAWQSGCRSEPPPGPSVELPPRPTSLPAPAHVKTSSVASAAPTSSASAASVTSAASAVAADKPYTGPLLGALMPQTAIFSKPEFAKRELGYIRLGGKVPVETNLVKDQSGKCSQGWYHLVDGGYVCARHATLDIKSPQVRLGITPPNLEDVLPYKYAHNSAHGTPLYRSVPSREEMLKYEPYLDAAKKAKRKAEREKEKEEEADRKEEPPETPDKGEKGEAVAKAESLGLFDLDAGAAPADEKEKPWWQQPTDKSKPLHVKLDDLSQDADGTLVKRMVKGFFVAIDKQFAWNNRSWYKTTGGLVAPADRMYLVKPPTAQGLDFPEGVKQLGFVTASKASKWEIDGDPKNAKPAGSVARFTPVGLTGASETVKGTVFRQTTEGGWM